MAMLPLTRTKITQPRRQSETITAHMLCVTPEPATLIICHTNVCYLTQLSMVQKPEMNHFIEQTMFIRFIIEVA